MTRETRFFSEGPSGLAREGQQDYGHHPQPRALMEVSTALGAKVVESAACLPTWLR